MKKLVAAVLALTLALTAFLSCGVYAKAGELTDIKGHWAEKEIRALVEKGIVNGQSNGIFNPQGQVTRVQFVKMLVEAMKYTKASGNSFTDNASHWGKSYIETAVKQGIVVPSETGKRFNPDAALTRIDMVTMICRTLKLKSSTGKNPFTDMAKANGYATKAYEEYLTRGTVENAKLVFKAGSSTSRAEAAVMVVRLLEYRSNPGAYREKMKAAANAGGVYVPKLERDLEFEGFMQTEAAYEYAGINQWFTVGEGKIILRGYRYEAGKEGYVDDSKFKNINVLTYNLVKELTKCARKDHKYVKAYSNGENVIISFYLERVYGENGNAPANFTFYLFTKPRRVSETDKYISHISIDATKLWERFDSNGYAIEKDLIEAPYEEALKICFKEIYGEKDGSALYSHFVQEYREKYKKNFKYVNDKTEFINGVQVNNSTKGGVNCFYTNLK